MSLVALRHSIRAFAFASLAFCFATLHAQTPAAPATSQTPKQPIAPVQTTIEVHADTKDAYQSDTVSVGTLNGASLRETPISATVVTREVLSDQGARTLADVIKNDASIGEDYAPVGYYGDYQIRGFPIDLATGLQLNGLTIAGEQEVPLENKERVEFLKGIAGVESGVASAGGLINFVTKRPRSFPQWTGPQIIAAAPTEPPTSAASSAAQSRSAHASTSLANASPATSPEPTAGEP